MNYKFKATPNFAKELKTLAKKYKSLKQDIEELKKEYEENPLLGNSLGGGYRKIRLKISSKKQGKRGVARVITHEVILNIATDEETTSVLLISIYDKSDFSTIDITPFKDFVKEYREQEEENLKNK